MSERDELREKIVDILRVAAAIGPHAVEGEGRLSKLATDFLALIPPQPKLEWRAQEYFLGNFPIGHVFSHASLWIGQLTSGEDVHEGYCEEEVRTAVEQAVKEALGWPK